jgi:hypothetical protein
MKAHFINRCISYCHGVLLLILPLSSVLAQPTDASRELLKIAKQELHKDGLFDPK